MKATFLGKDLKALIAGIGKFPSLGNFAGADLIHLQVSEGKATAYTFGIVLSKVQVPAEGKMLLLGLDRRGVEGFVSICADAAKVILTKVDNQVAFASRGREALVPASTGQVYKSPLLKGISSIAVTKDLAERMNYLSEVALNDSSRAELCCVMLTPDKQAIACNQKTVALLKTGCKLEGNVAVPLALSRVASPGDQLFPGTKETTLRSGIATYSMPSSVRAQKEYPFGIVRDLAKQSRDELLAIDGQKFVTAITECATCLGQLSRTEVIVDMKIAGGKLDIRSTNGGVRFSTLVSVLTPDPAEVEFRAPLEGLKSVLPFIGEKVVFSRGKHGDLFLTVTRGWVLYPCWETKKGKKK